MHIPYIFGERLWDSKFFVSVRDTLAVPGAICCSVHICFARITLVFHEYAMRTPCRFHTYAMQMPCALHAYYMHWRAGWGLGDPIIRNRVQNCSEPAAKVWGLIWALWSTGRRPSAGSRAPLPASNQPGAACAGRRPPLAAACLPPAGRQQPAEPRGRSLPAGRRPANGVRPRPDAAGSSNFHNLMEP